MYQILYTEIYPRHKSLRSTLQALIPGPVEATSSASEWHREMLFRQNIQIRPILWSVPLTFPQHPELLYQTALLALTRVPTAYEFV